ncbi:MAG: UvrD-helicase domain-containing protein [Desulfosalsimonas sp.]|uniref:UvrD-helicase domain-containing protein n=1 Tax=Desulfosalsimonas sp. TaxID=3073848 RepID=UPI003970751A
MKYIADLHIHSRFSRATAKNLDFPHLYMAARQKGITVVATGDSTHPQWLDEIRQYLEPAEQGMFKLKDDLAEQCEKQISVAGNYPVRFVLSTEISNIYKKGGVTRKLHHLVFFPELSHVEKFNARLSQIGNLKADGRPILGLDSKRLLEIVLETHESGFLIPAHIWTPWFSLFGSKSGFDSVAECFEDLSDHIFAVETGLSSDPPMNWRIRDLDNRTLVSNSDAHSPANLGREANLFDTELCYDAMRSAIATGNPERFLGTLEFFPEEGKYHQDGHRKCGVNLHPRQTIENSSICPVCGNPVTVGVLYRVEQLAGRKEGEKPEKTHPFYSLIPLAEILSELLSVGPKSKKVIGAWQTVISRLGPELRILHDMPVEEIRASGNGLLAQAVERMRAGRVHRQPGFDGQYGRVTIFTPEQREHLTGQQVLFDLPAGPVKKKPKSKQAITPSTDPEPAEKTPGPQTPLAKNHENPVLASLNPDQNRAVTHAGGPLLISAGPGTGKTRTLTCRIAWLLQTRAAAPEQILAVTFTHKAADQMKQRLAGLLGPDSALPEARTFHSFCFSLLKEIKNTADHGIADEQDRRALLAEAADMVKARGKQVNDRIETLMDLVAAAKQQILGPDDDLKAIAGNTAPVFSEIYSAYQDILDAEHLWDYEDLLCQTVLHLDSDPALCETLRKRLLFVFIDEYQDLNYAQYRLVRQLCPADGQICVIGDPDQSIYGFRGSDPAYFQCFEKDFPGAQIICLRQNYRSTQTILSAAGQVLDQKDGNRHSEPVFSGISGTPHLHLIQAADQRGEAVAVGKTIEQMVGGMGFDFHDFDKAAQFAGDGAQRSFADFAVLFRTRAQAEVFAGVFEDAGIPCRLASKAHAWEAAGIAEPVSALKILEGCAASRDLIRVLAVLFPDFPKKDMADLKAWSRKRGLSVNGLLAEAHRTGVECLSSWASKSLGRFINQLTDLETSSRADPAPEKLEKIFQWLGPFLPEAHERTKETLEELRRMAGAFGADVGGFTEALALCSDPDFCKDDSEKVALLTLHAAKGLEFPVVFVAGCEDGLIPYHGADSKPTDIEEERRLFYVGITRAMSELFLCSARTRKIYGQTRQQKPSPFMAEIAADLKKPASDNFSKKSRQIQLQLFSQ